MARKNYEMDMCHGPLLGKIFLFALPVLLSGVLQLLFNAVDVIVVGRFAGSQALAAVGSNTSLVNLIVNVFIGISIGTNVLVARHYGAGEYEEVKKTVHTSILTSLIFGVILIFIGFFLARPLLEMMGTPEDVIDLAQVYLRIFFVGMPVNMLYNFGAAILRAVGDTRRPLYYLVIAGVLNVILNLIFVIVFHMSVAGVALATIISQAVSAILVVRCLMKSEGCVHLALKELRIYKKKLIQMFQIGLPAGLQGAIFSVSNVMIQSTINSFGSLAMAGNAAAANIEGFIYLAMNALSQTSLSFTSQNAGAGDFKRVRKIFYLCNGIVVIIGLVLGIGTVMLGKPLVGIFSSDPDVIVFGQLRLTYICFAYFLCGIMDVVVGSLRGLGSSVMPMIISLTGACILRIVWLYTIFQINPTLENLYISYPISWLVTAVAQIICFIFVLKKSEQRSKMYC